MNNAVEHPQTGSNCFESVVLTYRDKERLRVCIGKLITDIDLALRVLTRINRITR